MSIGLMVEAVVKTPDDLTDEAERLLRELAIERNETVADEEEGLVSRIRSAFR